MQLNRYKFKLSSIIVIGILFVYVTSCDSHKKQVYHQNKQGKLEAITFILGDDADIKNPFYLKAELYYRYDEKNKTEKVITSCHSLIEVQEYLIANANHLPWDLINLVSHGNPYLGLSVKITPDGKRASLERIQESIENGTFKKFSKNVINEETTIALHGCGLGNNLELIKAIQSAFSNEGTSPKVVSSKYFEYYVSDESNEQDVTKYLAEFWITNYKMGYKPSNHILEKRLQAKYPENDVNWKEALLREQATKTGEVFHYTFEVPVKWVFRYDCKDSIPKLENENLRLQWASQNPRISQDLQKLNITPEKFNWWMRSIYVKNEDGSKTPALWVKGYCTMLCVLRLLPQE
jgi:hypothetical protein